MAIYLDNNATTRVAPQAVQAMLPYLTEHYGNASSKHGFGNAASQALRKARGQVQSLIGAKDQSEIIFTSGGTESDTTAILSAVKCFPEKREIILSSVEHSAVKVLCEDLGQSGYTIHEIPVDPEHGIDLDAYERALSPNVALASIMWANNETGAFFPVLDMAEKARAAGVLFHTDAVQAAGKIQIHVADTAINMLSISAHKLHAPKGIGALYLRKGTPFKSLIFGGPQEGGRRAGTENVPLSVAFGVAAELAVENLSEHAKYLAGLRDDLQCRIQNTVPGVKVLAEKLDRLPNTLSVAFHGLKSEAILDLLDRQGIAVSSGSACKAGAIRPSSVALAMGLTHEDALGIVRFSLCAENTPEEMVKVANAVSEVAQKLRGAITKL